MGQPALLDGWRIAACELRIPRRSGLAAHRMVALVRPDGRAVRQINGLASWLDGASSRWRHKPIGYLPSDRLRGYDTNEHPATFMPMHGCAPGARDLASALASGCAIALAEGLTEEEAEARLAPAVAAIRRINALSPGPEGGAGLPYPFLGFGANSNSVFSTVLAAMGLAEPRFARPAFLTPGRGRLVLADADMSAISLGADLHHSSADSTGARNSASG